MGEELPQFSKRILILRKERGWSQPEMAKKVGTSGPIIGRYERGEMTPSIDVAKKFAEAFDVTLDYLVSDRAMPDVLKNGEMLRRLEAIDSLSEEDRQRILSVVDSLIRDANARQAYAD